MKAVGQRDMSIQEVMHDILSIKLCGSSFQVITVPLQGTRKVRIVDIEILTRTICSRQLCYLATV